MCRATRWADVAADTGYADQAHLCRVTRRIIGCSPKALRQSMAVAVESDVLPTPPLPVKNRKRVGAVG